MARKRNDRKSLDDIVDGGLNRVSKTLDRVPGPLRNIAAQWLTSPIIGLFAGGLLVFAGMFLFVAWNISIGPLIDAHRYAKFTGSANGSIVDAWAALSFDPAQIPNDKLRWYGYAQMTFCVVVEFPAENGWPLRRAFCGDRFDFSDDFSLIDSPWISPGVPFAFARDAKGFAVQQIRLSADALNWLKNHPPYSTFMLGNPPAATAYDALREQFDRPTAVALSSWSSRIPNFALSMDPSNPAQAMPAKYVERRRDELWIGGFVIAVIFAGIGFFVWRLGMTFLLGGLSAWLFWAITIAPLLTLPWWSEAFPNFIRYVNRDWADIATMMIDSMARTTRMNATEPADALLADGAHIDIRIDQGRYADTFGNVPFRLPEPPPADAKAAIGALTDQVSAYVAGLDSTATSALFVRLRELNDANLKQTQSLFFPAAEAVIRNADKDRRAHEAAKNFLLFTSGGGYFEDRLNATEVPPKNAD
ncbi:MAG: hypothetical protein ABJB01_10290 [Rudaea sp.]